MSFPKKPWKLLVAVLTFAVFAWVASPSYSSSDQAWELAKAFAEAIRYQESHYFTYLVIIAAPVLLTLTAIMIYMRNRNSSEDTDSADETANDKNQKRAWFRLSLNIDLHYAPAGTEDFRKGKLVDLSGGGLMFSTNQQLKKNDWLELNFELNPETKLDLNGRVARVVEKPGSGEKRSFLIGVEFSNIKRSEQDKIISFLLREQQMRI